MTATKRDGHSLCSLTGYAREKALRWLRDYNGFDHSDRLAEMFKRDLIDHYGFTNGDVCFSLGHCQGDGVAFDAHAWVTHLAELGQCEPLREIVKQFQMCAVLEGWVNIPEFTVNVKRHGRYTHSESMSVEVNTDYMWEDDDFAEHIVNLSQCISFYVKEISKAMEKDGYSCLEDWDSEEYLLEHAEANDYRFDDDGEFLG